MLEPDAGHWILARVPLDGTVAATVLAHGVGGINVEACRVGTALRPKMVRTATVVAARCMSARSTGATASGELTSQGRWPTNVVFDEHAAALLDEQTGTLSSHGGDVRVDHAGMGYRGGKGSSRACRAETGGASRFFPVFGDEDELEQLDERTAGMIRIEQGEALDVLRAMPDASCHSLVTDPPAGIAFMGKSWDRDRGGRAQWVAWLSEILSEARRVLRPGSHALVWALPKTQHWTATALEDAGFEIVDVIVHLYGQGFPKSTDVAKQIDKRLGAQRPVVGVRTDGVHNTPRSLHKQDGFASHREETFEVTAPGSDEAKRWQGWGTALKPAAEHWILARVPLAGTIAANVLEHGTGGINVDACRVECEGGSPAAARRASSIGDERVPGHTLTGEEAAAAGRMANPVSVERYTEARAGEQIGRWPANLVLDQDAAAELDAQSGTLAGRGNRESSRSASQGYGGGWGPRDCGGAFTRDAGGGASRFFYTPKPSTAERGEGNVHPTVKPIALMRWLIRLITPPGGTVLDPFAGSGTTVLAALAETCFNCIAIEREGDYASIALKRAQRIDPLFHDVPAIARRDERADAQRRRAARAELHERTGLVLEDVSRAAYW